MLRLYVYLHFTCSKVIKLNLIWTAWQVKPNTFFSKLSWIITTLTSNK